MILKFKRKPEELLYEYGFRKAPDTGWQIVERKNPKKPDDHDYRTKIPLKRVHATVVGQEVNLHHDLPDGPRRHRGVGRDKKVLMIAQELKKLDN